MLNKENNENKIINKDLEDILETSMLQYSLSVISDRAIPDLRDGLKPSQRRILYACKEKHLSSTSNFSKSASVVGLTLGEFHPHGDASIYNTLVNMAQDFKMRYPLIEGQGNFGSLDGDKAAAARYTELRLSKLGEIMLLDTDPKIIPFQNTYNDENKEPKILSSYLPNILMNGSEGIAVAMSTKMPSHNLEEIYKALDAYIHNKDINVKTLSKYIKGPDFPIGGVVLKTKSFKNYLLNGKGSFKMRADYDINIRGQKQEIIINSLPFNLKKKKAYLDILELMQKDKPLEDKILSIRDESNIKEPVRLVLELKRDVNPINLMEFIYKNSSLERNFNARNVCLYKGKPLMLNLKEIIKYYLDYQVEIYTNKLKSQKDSLESLEAKTIVLIKAAENIVEVAKIIKEESSKTKAQKKIHDLLDITYKEVDYIYSSSLNKLQRLNKEKEIENLEEIKKEIKDINLYLDDNKKLENLILDNIKSLANKLDNKRRTTIISLKDFKKSKQNLYTEKKNKENILSIAKDGYVYNKKLKNSLVEIKFNSKNDIVLISTDGYVKKIDTDIIKDNLGYDNKVKIYPDNLLNAFIDNNNDYIVYNNQDRFLRCDFTDVNKIQSIESKGVKLMDRDANKDFYLKDIFKLKDKDKTLVLYTPGQKQSKEFSLEDINKQNRNTKGRKMFDYKDIKIK